MSTPRSKRGAALAMLAAAALLVGAAGPAAASDFYLEFGAGVACDFGLGVEGTFVGPQNYREFTDAEGNVIWTLSAGRGNDLTFTNLATDATLSTEATGAVTRTVLHPDGSYTTTMTGGNVLIMFPTDEPAGPSTTLYHGRVVFDVDLGGVTTIQSTAGTAMDICAALSD